MIILGADHAGLTLKNKIKANLTKKGYSILDVGAFEVDKNDDFSHYVSLMYEKFLENAKSQIIAVCGTGIGMNIGLNKCKNVRCVCGHTEQEVMIARKHNDVNALALAGREISAIKACKLVDAFLETRHLGGKYKRRMNDLEK